MKLTDEQMKKLQDHIQENWKAPVRCPVCWSNEWNLSNHIYELREFQRGSLSVGSGSGGIVPLSPVICETCGNTVLINPLVAGIDLGGKGNESK